MPSKAKRSVQLPLTESVDIGQVASEAMKNTRYIVNNVSIDTCSVIANYSFRDPKTHTTWNYDYTVRVEWGVPTLSDVDVEVSEKNYSGNHSKCSERANEIVNELLRLSERFQRTKLAKPKDDRFGGAEWASPEELLANSYIVDRDKLVNGQFVLGPWSDTQFLVIPIEYTSFHIIVRGPTGVGKSSSFYEPNLALQPATSAIVTEATIGSRVPELFKKTSGYRASKGHSILYFNPIDLKSNCINPLDTIRLAAGDKKIQLVEAVADLMISNTAGKTDRSDPAFEKSEKLLLSSLIAHAASADPNYGHFGAVRWLLQSDPEQLESVMDKSPWSFATREFNGWKSVTRENFRYAVMGGLLARMNSWLTPTAMQLTSKSSFTQEQLMQGLFTLYLSSPGRRPDLKVLTSLIFNFVANLASDYASKHPLMLLLDEFTNFGRVAGIDELLSLIRKTGVSIALGYQDSAQLEKVYTLAEARIIEKQPGTTMYFRPRDPYDAEQLSKALGTFTFHDRTLSDRGSPRDSYYSKRLIRADELLNMDKEEAIFRTPSTKPIFTKKFHWNKFLWATEMPPIVMPEQTVHPRILEGLYPGLKPGRPKTKDEEEAIKQSPKPLPPKPIDEEEEDEPIRDQTAVDDRIQALDRDLPLDMFMDRGDY